MTRQKPPNIVGAQNITALPIKFYSGFNDDGYYFRPYMRLCFRQVFYIRTDFFRMKIARSFKK
jgi:hypothetical protein